MAEVASAALAVLGDRDIGIPVGGKKPVTILVWNSLSHSTTLMNRGFTVHIFWVFLSSHGYRVDKRSLGSPTYPKAKCILAILHYGKYQGTIMAKEKQLI
jgi:hypothetical protein